MKNVKVRCWEIYIYKASENKKELLFITYPEENMGYNLITCINCGMIYAVDVSKAVYLGPPLEEKLKDIQCLGCNINLSKNYVYYPDNYRNEDGRILKYERPKEIPPESESIIKEFPGIYD